MLHGYFSNLWTKSFLASHQLKPANVVIASPTPKQHLQDLRRLLKHGILINPSRCLFGCSELDFFLSPHMITQLCLSYLSLLSPGLNISCEGLLDLSIFTTALFPMLLILCNHYILSSRLPSQNPWPLPWLMMPLLPSMPALAKALLLSYILHSWCPYCLMTDASDTAVGAVLQQYIDGVWRPISFKEDDTNWKALEHLWQGLAGCISRNWTFPILFWM